MWGRGAVMCRRAAIRTTRTRLARRLRTLLFGGTLVVGLPRGGVVVAYEVA